MLNKLYLTVKKKMSQRIFKGFDETIPLKTGFETALRNFADFILTNKEYFLFAEQFSNSPLIHKLSHEEGNVLFQPIYSLFERGKSQNVFKQLDTKLLVNFTFFPIIQLANTVEDKEIKQVVEYAYDLSLNYTEEIKRIF